MPTRFCCRVVFGLLLAAVSVLPSQAADKGQDLGIKLKLEGAGLGPAHIENDQGKVAVTYLRGTLEYSYFVFSYTNRRYHWDQVSRLPFGNGADDPWEQLHSISLGAKDFKGRINQRWGYFWGIWASSMFEEETSDSFSGSGTVGLSYVISPNLIVSFGVGGYYHLEVDNLFMVVGALAWNPGIEKGFHGALGFPESFIGYRFSPAWDLRLSAGFEERVYRLADDSTVQPQGYLRSRTVLGLMELKWTPRQYLTLSIAAGYHFLRRFDIFDSEGEGGRDYDINGTLGGGISLELSF